MRLRRTPQLVAVAATTAFACKGEEGYQKWNQSEDWFHFCI